MVDRISALAAEELARRQGQAPAARPFTNPTPPGSDVPALAGFVGSVFSSIPELFGAAPTPTAEQFRVNHPIAGLASEMLGFAVPYFGAEKIAQLPSVAPKLARGVENVLGVLGRDAASSPILAGATRELLVNAPVEASRLAVGSTYYPENHDLWSDVALSTLLTGGIGGIAGAFRAGGKVLSKPGQIAGADFTLAPTHQLKMVLDENAPLVNTTKEEFVPFLREQVFNEAPGIGGASKKELPYVLPLEGQSAEDTAAINSLFKLDKPAVSEETGKTTGLIKQKLIEGRGRNQLRVGGLQNVVDLLPESFQSADDIAKEVQFPRVVQVADKNGARQFAGLTSKPGWLQVNDRFALMQERDGSFVFSYKLADGTGQQVGKGAGKTKAGAQYLVGKTLNPGKFAPEAEKMADLVTAKWAKWGAAFSPGRYEDVFNKNQDLFIKAMSVVDYRNIARQSEKDWKAGFVKKLGSQLAKEEGFLDTKFGYKNSARLQEIADAAYATFKPTEFLQRQNPVYGRFFGLLRNAVRTADDLAVGIMRGKAKPRQGVRMTKTLAGKDVDYESVIPGLRSIADAVSDFTEPEAQLVRQLSGTDKLSPEGVEELVKAGQLSRRAGDAVNELRSINEHVIQNYVLPVFRETGHDVQWLENHLGIPHTPRGSLFYVVKNEAGKPVHLAFGETGAAAQREAKLVAEEGRAAGKNWTIDKADPKHLAAESEDKLSKLHEQVVTNARRTKEEGEAIYKAMSRLAAIKASSGRHPAIPVSSGMFKERTGISTSFKLQNRTKEELLSDMDGHLRQLLRFAGVQSWKERFGSVSATMLQKSDPTLYQDLTRKAGQMLGVEGQVTNALNNALRPILGRSLGAKPATKIAASVNQFMHLWNLGILNPSFALLNLLTPLQTVAPWLAHMQIASREDLAKTMFMDLVPSPLPGGVAGSLNPMKVLFESIRLMKDPPKDLNGFFGQALDDGLFHPQQFEEWVGRHTRAQQTFADAYKEGGMPELLRKGSTYMAEQSERLSRLTAFNSAYILGKNFFGLEGDALYRFMRRGTELTMYNYAAVDRARLFTGPVGSILGLWKNWQLHFLGNMMNYAGLATKGEAFAPLMWTGASALALGGIGATPLVALADGLGAWDKEDKNSFLWTQKNFSPEIGDAIYFGLPSFLGVSLQASSSIPGTDVRNETASLFSFALLEKYKRLQKALGDMMEARRTTGHAFADPNVRDELWAATMPRAMTKLFSAIEGDYVKSMTTGSPQVRDLSPFARMVQGLGWNSTDVERYQVASRLMYESQQAHEELVLGLGKALSDAQLNGDSEKAEEIMRKAAAAGVLPSVFRSAATHNTRESEGDILSRYNKADQSVYRQVLEGR